MRVAGILAGGVLYAVALPPIDWAPAAWIALVPLLLAVRDTDCGSAFRYGCLFGYAFGWSVLWSLVEAAIKYLGLPLPIAVAGSCLWFVVVVGVPCGLFAAGASLLMRSRHTVGVLIGVPALWVAAELVRGRLIGQPWALLGYTQHDELALIQLAATTGVYGISFLIALAGAGIAHGVQRSMRGVGVRGSALPPACAALVIGCCWLGGWLVLQRESVADLQPITPRRTVAVVQTGLTPALRWSPVYTRAQVGAHLRATDAIAPSVDPALIVWPEYAVPEYLESDAGLAAVVAQAARRHRADLIFGAPRHDRTARFNGLRLITADGRNGGHYDKRRLVPFAESRPFALGTQAGDHDGAERFSAGTAPGLLPGFVKLGVTVCHEIIHPDLVNDSVRRGAELLVNVANDSWIEMSSPGGAEQHLAMATFRAVETRRYLARAALTGVSAIVDPFGRVLAQVPSGRAGVASASVRGLDGVSWYVRLGDGFAWACVALAMLAVAMTRRENAAA